MIGFGTGRVPLAKGVSLIEGLTSLLILMVGVAGMAIAYQNTIYQSVSARNNTQAAQIAQTVLAEMAATSPSEWDPTALKDRYTFTYEGKRVPASDPDAYYRVEVRVIDELGFSNVEIGVIWTGWRAEEERGGFANQSSEFAYVLNAMLSPQFTSGGTAP